MTRKDDASLSGAYALNALDAEEAKAFEAHLAESEDTRNEVTELADTAVLLGLAVAPETPPASLKASIMAQLATTPQLDREPATSPDARFAGRAETAAQARWFQRPVNAIIGIAAAVALIIGGGVAVNAISTNVTQSAEANQLAAIQAASDSQSLKGSVAGGGKATLVYAPSLKASALIVEGMNALPADKVYELWYINEAGARPAGTFTIGPDGKMWQVLEGTMTPGDAVGVTVEPHGGSTAPTTDPVLVLASA
jgi:anti-sigma-K factor RskA